MARGKRLQKQQRSEGVTKERQRVRAAPPPPKTDSIQITRYIRSEEFSKREQRMEVWYLGEMRWVELAPGVETLQQEWLGRRSGAQEWRTQHRFRTTEEGQVKEPITRRKEQ